ncbi:MAG: SCP2 sterol-binding domain-containing protein [Marinobacterium sp.]|nr:SCP2 sterol-binding domain-containing protein [Marinobacterium sp.]
MSALTSVDQIIDKFPSRFIAERAADFKAVFQFELNDHDDFYLHIANQQCLSTRGEHDDPDITLIMDSETLLEVINGELDGMNAFMQGRLKAEGNLLLATRLGDLFSRERQS